MTFNASGRVITKRCQVTALQNGKTDLSFFGAYLKKTLTLELFQEQSLGNQLNPGEDMSFSIPPEHVVNSSCRHKREQHDYFNEQLIHAASDKHNHGSNGIAQEETGTSKTVTEVRKYVGRLGLAIGKGGDREKSEETTRVLPAQEPKKIVQVKGNDRSSLSTEELLKEKQSRVIRCVSLILNMPSERVMHSLTPPCMDLYPDSLLQGKFELTEVGLVALSYLARTLKGTMLDFRFCAEEFPLKLWEFKCYYFSSIPTLETIVLGHEVKSGFQVGPYQKCLTANGSKVRLTAEVLVDPFKNFFPQQSLSHPNPAQFSARPLPKPQAAAAVINLPQAAAAAIHLPQAAAAAIHLPQTEEVREAR